MHSRRWVVGAAPPLWLLVAAIGLAGCGGSGGSPGGSSQSSDNSGGGAVRLTTTAAPAGLLAGTAPQPNGTLWVLAGTRGVRAINEIDVATGKKDSSVGVSTAAQGLAQSSTGVLALGLATRSTGAVELLNASTGAVTGTIPVGARVLSVAFGDDGVTLYVLNGTTKTRSVTVINTTTQKVTGSIGLPSDARSIFPNAQQTAIWSIQASGVVQETSLTRGHAIASFPTGDPGIALVAAPSNGALYVLKGTNGLANIAVISVATEQIKRVLPAAEHSVDLGISLDGSELYDFVGTRSYGNIQTLDI